MLIETHDDYKSSGHNSKLQNMTYEDSLQEKRSKGTQPASLGVSFYHANKEQEKKTELSSSMLSQ